VEMRTSYHRRSKQFGVWSLILIAFHPEIGGAAEALCVCKAKSTLVLLLVVIARGK
jgi:hypothetical protein